MGSASMGIVWKKPAHLGSMERLPPSAGCDRQPQAELFLEGVQLVRELAWLHTPLRERKLSRAGRGSCKDKCLSLAGSQDASLLSKEEPGLGKTQCPRLSHTSEREKHLPGVTWHLEVRVQPGGILAVAVPVSSSDTLTPQTQPFCPIDPEA